jgi:hypothetical protein
MLRGVPVWSSLPQGDPMSVGHRMDEDGYGRASLPVCGRTSEGLFFRRDVRWDQVPVGQRCARCELISEASMAEASFGVGPPVGTLHLAPR